MIETIVQIVTIIYICTFGLLLTMRFGFEIVKDIIEFVDKRRKK